MKRFTFEVEIKGLDHVTMLQALSAMQYLFRHATLVPPDGRFDWSDVKITSFDSTVENH